MAARSTQLTDEQSHRESLAAENERLTKQLADADHKSEIARSELQQSLERQTQELAEATKQVERLKTAAADHSQSMTVELELARQQQERLQQQLTASEQQRQELAAQQATVAKEAEATATAATDRVSEWQGKFNEQADQVQRMSKWAKNAQVATADLKKLLQQQQQAVSDANERQQVTLTKHVGEIRTLNESLTSARVELRHYQSRDVETQQQLTGLQDQIHDQQQQLNAATSETQALREKIAGAETELLKRGDALRTTTMERDALKKRIADLQLNVKEHDDTPRSVVLQEVSSQQQSLFAVDDQAELIKQLRLELSQQERELIERENAYQDVLQQLHDVAKPTTPSPFSPERNVKAKLTKKARAKSKQPANKPSVTMSLVAKSKTKSKSSKPSDDLTIISGIGPVWQRKLRGAGIKTYQQIASWSATDIAEFEERLNIRGRIKRERWVQQAKKLCK